MSPRDELAAILRSLQPEHAVPDDGIRERIVGLVGTDRLLAGFTLGIVCDLMAEHEEDHGKAGALVCDRCIRLVEIVRDLGSVF
jgi:hypothetical protein